MQVCIFSNAITFFMLALLLLSTGKLLAKFTSIAVAILCLNFSTFPFPIVNIFYCFPVCVCHDNIPPSTYLPGSGVATGVKVGVALNGLLAATLGSAPRTCIVGFSTYSAEPQWLQTVAL